MTAKSGSVCVLASGGLDSAVLLKHCLERWRTVYPVYVEAGLRWEKAERHWLGRLLAALRRPGLMPLEVLQLPAEDLYGRHWSLGTGKAPSSKAPWDSVYLPGRNLLLLAKAGVFCSERGIGTLALGALKSNPFKDSRPAFFREMERVYRLLFSPVKVVAPLARLRKAAVVRAGKGLPLHLTFSCVDPRGYRPCGRCTKCFEREEGFRKAGSAGATG